MAGAREKQRRRGGHSPDASAGGGPRWPYAAALVVAAAWAAGFCRWGSSGSGGSAETLARGGLHGNPRIFADDGGPTLVDPSRLSQKRVDRFWLHPTPQSAKTEQQYLAAKRTGRAKALNGTERREMSGTSLQAQLSCIGSRDGRWEAFQLLSSMELVPRFSKAGYQVMKIPAEAYRAMREHADKSLPSAGPDKYVKYGIRSAMDGVSGADMWMESNGIIFREPYVPLYTVQPKSQVEDVIKLVQPIVEKFAGVPLEVTAHHGIRYYLRNNWMPFHTDRVNTHVIGLNMHIHSRYDNASEPWMFEIWNHETNTIDALSLEEGEMVVYEAIGNMHARPAPLRGDYHGSAFLHFAPLRWPYDRGDILAQVPPGWDATSPCDSRDSSLETQWFALGSGFLVRDTGSGAGTHP